MTRTLAAFLLSFLVYLVPILHVHGGTLVGIYLWAALVEGRSAREPLWLAMDAGFAVVLQIAWFFALRWILAGSRLRWLLLAGLAPVTAVAVVWTYLLVIPTLFLIEADDIPETGDWPVACSVAGAATVGLPAGVTLTLERAGEVWIRFGDGAYGVLSMPDCRVVRRELFFPGVRGSVGYVGSGGAAYYRMDSDGDGRFEHWYLDEDQTAPKRLVAPAGIDHWTPVVDAAADAIAWLETERSDDRKLLGHVLAVRTLPDGPEFRVPLHMEPRSSPLLLDLDLAAGQFTILGNYSTFHAIGLDGRATTEPVKPAGFEHIGTSFRLLSGGWVAWDGYRENARYRVAWSLPAGGGMFEIPKGRGVTAVSVDSAGRHIAVSVSGNLSIGSMEDSVRVIRVADGTEVWRRYMPRYTRSQVAFLGSGHLAVTHIVGGQARVDVLEIPAP
jgi:hypothetical protein